MTDLFEYIQTRKNDHRAVLGTYQVTDLNLISPHPLTFMFTAEGQGEAAGHLTTVAVRAIENSAGDQYEVDITDTNTAKTESYGTLTRVQVETLLQTGQKPDASTAP